MILINVYLLFLCTPSVLYTFVYSHAAVGSATVEKIKLNYLPSKQRHFNVCIDVCLQMMRVVEIETQSVSSYIDIIKKVILLIGDKNLSTCKVAGRVLVTVGNEMRYMILATHRSSTLAFYARQQELL